MRENCDKCEKLATSLTLLREEGCDDLWMCRHCLDSISNRGCNLFEYGHENPADPDGSTAHVRDIKDRRYDFKEKRMFYYSKECGKTYFIPKG